VQHLDLILLKRTQPQLYLIDVRYWHANWLSGIRLATGTVALTASWHRDL